MSAAEQDDRAESIRMIRDSAAAVAPPGGDLKRIRDLRFQDPGFDAGLFRQMGEMGWIGLRVPEALGGAGLGLGEMCALAEELGGALVPEPLIAASLSAQLLAAAGRHGALPVLLAGEVLVLTAWQERPDTLEVPGTPDAPRRFLPMASGADFFLVPVREAGRLALYELPAARCVPTVERTQDGGNLGTILPNLAEGTKLADDIGPALAEALDEAALVTAAYLLGGMERAFGMTLDYLRTRQQFGKIIGTFQALQHKAADARMQISLTRAAVEEAALGDAAPALASRAKARASEAAMLVQQLCVQLHGGIGYTDDYDVGLYLRRAMVLAPMYGGAALHRRRFTELSPEMEDA